ncbi:MAG TPA: phosphoribosyltransferase family protein [Methanomassiliicoccales archaeon]|jgi:predicted phosphoribosyltransferase
MGLIVEDMQLRQKRFVFRDRAESGMELVKRLEKYRGKDLAVLAIPSGGLPIAAEIAEGLGAVMDVIIVRKLHVPLNPEAGFGAMSMDGDAVLNNELVSDMALTHGQIEKAKGDAMREGLSRERALRGVRPFPDLKGKVVILVDDGLASGYTMLAAVRKVKQAHPASVVVAVPTGSDRSVEMVAREVDEVVCLNIRGMPFAVADAYRNWYDIDEEEAVRIMRYGNRP